MKLNILVTSMVVFIGTNSVSFAQNQSNDSLQHNQPNTIENQFVNLIEKSNNWERFKVVPKDKLYTIKKNVQDSLKAQRNLILEKTNIITNNEQKINDLKGQIGNLEQNLNELKDQKDSVNFFGTMISKGLYSSIVWGIIIVLASLLSFYIFKFTKSIIVTRRSIKDLEDLQKEYEDYRSKAIEREQKVRRQLQDEINKNRGV